MVENYQVLNKSIVSAAEVDVQSAWYQCRFDYIFMAREIHFQGEVCSSEDSAVYEASHMTGSRAYFEQLDSLVSENVRPDRVLISNPRTRKTPSSVLDLAGMRLWPARSAWGGCDQTGL